MRHVITLAAVFLIRHLFIPPAVAQSEIGAPSLKFDTASIKLTDRSRGELNMILMPRNDSLVTIKGTTLRELISFAYHPGFGYVPANLVLGCPPWCERDEYDILAKTEGRVIPSPEQRKLMLRTLLEERFQLKIHREPKISPVLVLLAAKKGPRMKQSAPDESGPGGFWNCGPGCRDGRKVSMEMLAAALQGILEFTPSAERIDETNLPVLNKTGLSGEFDLKLKWSPGIPQANDTQPDGAPDIFTAVQEQLGLRLQRDKAPVEAIVVDQVARPSPN